MKRRLLIAAISVLALSLTVYGTLAYLTSNATANNVITAGNVKIELLDQTVSGDARTDFPEGGLKVMPGTTASKEVSVKNLANASWIRVYLAKDIFLENEPGIDEELSDYAPDWDTQPNGLPLAVEKAISLDINEDDWFFCKEDGFYYYRTPLEMNKTTERLFTTVTFSKDMGNLYQNSSLTIKVYAQAVQSANNGIPEGDDFTEVIGWPADNRIPSPSGAQLG